MKARDTVGPRIDEVDAAALAASLFEVSAVAWRLPSESDAVFRLEGRGGQRWALKVAQSDTDPARLHAENEIVGALAAALTGYAFPSAQRSVTGERIVWVDRALEPVLGTREELGRTFAVRLLSWVPGTPLERVPHSGPLLAGLGHLLADVDAALADVPDPERFHSHVWDLRHAGSVIEERSPDIADPERRTWLRSFAARATTRLAAVQPRLRNALIHGDANDHNVLVDVSDRSAGGPRIRGLVDFGDAVHSWRVGEPAIAAAYAMMRKPSPLAAAARLLAGYHARQPLSAEELSAFLPLVVLRLCVSVSVSASRRRTDPENAYLRVSEAPAWALLAQLEPLPFELGEAALRAALDQPHRASAAWWAAGLDQAGLPPEAGPTPDQDSLRAARARLIGPSLRLSYAQPLHIVRGWRQHLYAADGRAYLDCVNNVAHVGHAHPHVVRALARQAALLNTNTRYLSDELVSYAERLVSLFPEPLRICYLVCSGSEANELALRLARAHTGARNVVVIEGAYHGNTGSLVELSPYKFDGPGGTGRAAHVRVVPMPDGYRGLYRGHDEATGERYAAHVAQAAGDAANNGGLAAFFAEPILGCGGQIVPPEGYLRRSFEEVRNQGGVCVADEVQTGLGRVGSTFWAFELQDAVPDIVTLGKPMGNGHPIGAVITNAQIAASFDNGMEYFNSFGGNTVSCAVGSAVLDVIEHEGLQRHALETGAALEAGLRSLMDGHELIGDVRGRGLFLGVELVRDPETREPAAREASRVVEGMRERGILLSTDGPAHNVLKIKPPLPFDSDDAERVVGSLDEVLTNRG